jgi:glutamate N-acetyltransferase/amino-acid N-acetyltransferase
MEQSPLIIPGFTFAGLHCGIKDDASKKDLAVIYSESPQTVAAGVFTKNAVCAAPVRLCQQILKGKNHRLIIINSGIANAATGKLGLQDAQAVQKTAATLFNIKSNEVFISSTGKIGPRVPVDKIKQGLTVAQTALSPQGFYDTAEAIRTTDAWRKTAVHKGILNGKEYTLAVMAKGAGMIQPNMATMLCYILTDLAIEKRALQKMLKLAVDPTLNSLSVDGDTSTNDTVLVLANGLVGNKPIKDGTPIYKKILQQVTELLREMTISIAMDGEGATKCLMIRVAKARTDADARLAARAIANSPLVKTAMFGGDPNWGRILAAVGYSSARVDELKASVHLGQHKMYARGHATDVATEEVSLYIKTQKIIDITVDLGLGKGQALIYASDLTYDYVKLNAEYHT